MFTKPQQDLLRSVGRKPDTPDLGKPNPQLDEVILKLRRDNPRAFLRDEDLMDRVFVNQPVSGIRLKGYIYSLLEDR
jgi:hypothetical protein